MHSSSETGDIHSQSGAEDKNPSVIDLLIILGKHKVVIAAVTFLGAVTTAVYALYLPNVYTAAAKVLPPQQNQSAAAAMLAQIGGVVGRASGGSLGTSGPGELYVSMLRSRRVADAIVARFELQTVFGEKLPSGARSILEGRTKIKAEKDGILVIEVDDYDAGRAAEIANAYVEELQKLTGTLAVTEASQRRLFFERQLAQAKDNLTKIEVRAKQAFERGGLVQVEGTGKALLEATARLRAQMTVKQVQIGAMQTFAGQQNPELRAAQQELAVMKKELSRLETGAGPNGSSDASGREAVESLGMLRDVKYYEAVYELLAKQYEMAKMDEARDAALIQVLDPAIPPDFKSKPKRTAMVLLAALGAFLVACLVIVVRASLQFAASKPQVAEKLTLLRAAFLPARLTQTSDKGTENAR